MKTIVIFGLPETIQRSEEHITFDSQMPAKKLKWDRSHSPLTSGWCPHLHLGLWRTPRQMLGNFKCHQACQERMQIMRCVWQQNRGYNPVYPHPHLLVTKHKRRKSGSRGVRGRNKLARVRASDAGDIFATHNSIWLITMAAANSGAPLTISTQRYFDKAKKTVRGGDGARCSWGTYLGSSASQLGTCPCLAPWA